MKNPLLSTFYLPRSEQDAVTRLNNIVYTCADALIAFNQDFKFTLWNFAAAKLFGYTEAEVLGQNAINLIFPKEGHLQYGQGIGHFFNKKEIHLIIDKPIESVAKKQDGSFFPVEIALYPFNNKSRVEYAAVIRDISKRKCIQAQLEASYHYLDKIINSVADPIFVKDEQHRWVTLNDAFCRRMGYPREELIGKSDYDFHLESEADVYWQKDEEVLQTGKENVNEEYYTDPHGVLHVIITKKTLYTNPSGQKFIVGIIRDITEIRRAEAQIVQLNNELEQRVTERTRELERVNQELLLAKEKAEEGNKKKSDFLNVISHELQTPLTSIIGYSEMLNSGYAGLLNDKQKRYISNVLVSSKHLYNLINDILDIANIETRNIILDPKWIQLEAVFNGVRQLVSENASKKNINIIIDIEAGLDAIKVDPIRFKQILFNLLNNAVKFNKKDGSVYVTVTRSEDGAWLICKIKDTGIGISQNKLKELFSPFSQLDASYTRRADGAGIGLSLTKHLVELHQGNITVTSREGIGTEFVFTLPLQSH